MLVGRGDEHEAVERLLARAQDGESSVLVVRGEAGIGKTVLLQHVRETAVAAGFRVEDATGMEPEAQFAFAGLHQLCAALLARASALPEPQQAALGVAFGMREGAAPDRFLVGLAVLSLLAEVADDGPLLCLVDDAQWLDQASAQVLAFVARRVAAERVVLMFALRDPGDGDGSAFVGLPDLRLVGLPDPDARALLAATVPSPLNEAVRDRVVTEARGNPLALLELPRTVTPGGLANVYELPDASNVPGRVEEDFRRRSSLLPADTQALLLAAAADSTGETELLWRAAAALGITRDAAAPAEAAGLVEIDIKVRFRHPLVRSSIYRSASAPERRRAHRALLEATDAHTDPDRRAWHSALAAQEPDETVALDLLRSAGRAHARGGSAASAAFLQKAAELTPDPAIRAVRMLDAAHAKHESGAPEAALELLATAATGPLGALHSARLQQLRATIAFDLTHADDAPEMLMQAAGTLARLDAAQSSHAHLLALNAAMILGGLKRVRSLLTTRDSRGGTPPAMPGPVDLLLDGLVTAYLHGYEAGAPGLRRALVAFRDLDPAADDESERWLWLASRLALALYDDRLIHELGSRNVARSRETGAVTRLIGALTFQWYGLLLTGQFAQATELATEADTLARATGAAPWRWTWPVLGAWRGQRAETEALCTSILQDATLSAEAQMAHYALAVLHNGLSDYSAALDAALRACESEEQTIVSIALPELIEAAARANQLERASAPLSQLSSWARASGTPWALGLAARAQALASTDAVAEEHFREAIQQLRNCRITVHLARTHLVYGEWLRRQGRRQAARQQLRTAHEMLSGMGAEAFAARAGRELRATGEHPRSRTAQPSDALTAQELQIARLVATGATSREVGAQLFLSPRTIEAHLRNIFPKLGITSRRQLRDLRLP